MSCSIGKHGFQIKTKHEIFLKDHQMAIHESFGFNQVSRTCQLGIAHMTIWQYFSWIM
jgi:hypothetical protein